MYNSQETVQVQKVPFCLTPAQSVVARAAEAASRLPDVGVREEVAERQDPALQGRRVGVKHWPEEARGAAGLPPPAGGGGLLNGHDRRCGQAPSRPGHRHGGRGCPPRGIEVCGRAAWRLRCRQRPPMAPARGRLDLGARLRPPASPAKVRRVAWCERGLSDRRGPVASQSRVSPTASSADPGPPCMTPSHTGRGHWPFARVHCGIWCVWLGASAAW